MASRLAAIVLVHGAWHTPAHYAEFADYLRSAGFDIIIPHLPSCEQASRGSASMYDDATVVAKHVVDLVNEGRNVIMILHSYGGIVGTEAVSGLSKAERQKNGLPGGVVHMIYMCAFLLQIGEGTFSASLPRPNPDPIVFDQSNGTTFLRKPTTQLLYADVDIETAKKMESMLVPQSGRVGMDVLTHAAWRHIPVTYLMALQDAVIYPQWQRRQIQAVTDAGIPISVQEYDCSHSPFLSRTREMVQAVTKVAQETSGVDMAMQDR